MGGKGWFYGSECFDELQKMMMESLGVYLPDMMLDDAVADVYRQSMPASVH